MKRLLLILSLLPLFLFAQYPVYEDNGGMFAEGAFSVDVDCPATVNVNDILIASLLDADDDAFSAPPSGWAKIKDFTSMSTASTVIFWKRADGTEDGTTVTFRSNKTAGNGVYGVISRFSGCVTTGSPWDHELSNAVQQGTTVTVYGTTTQGNYGLAVSFIIVEDDVSISTVTDYTEEWYLTSTFGGDAAMKLQTQQVPTATTLANQTATLGGNDYRASHQLSLISSARTQPIAIFTNKGTQGTSTSSSTLSVPYPSTINANDRLFIMCTYSATNSPITLENLSGWVKYTDFLEVSDPGIKGGIFTKVATGSESGSVSVTTTASVDMMVATMYCFDGMSTDATFYDDAQADTRAAQPDATIPSGSLSSTEKWCYGLVFFYMNIDDAVNPLSSANRFWGYIDEEKGTLNSIPFTYGIWGYAREDIGIYGLNTNIQGSTDICAAYSFSVLPASPTGFDLEIDGVSGYIEVDGILIEDIQEVEGIGP